VALVSFAVVAPLATDMYLPGLPELSGELHAPPLLIQLSLTMFLVGFAVGQLIFGAVSDSRGRRVFLLGGSALFTLFTAACALAPDGYTLVGFRILEGLAGGGITVVGRAVVTDVLDGLAAARTFGTMAVLGGLAPVVAPVFGGVILAYASWRVVFGVVAATGACMLLAALLFVPESLPRPDRHPGGLRATGARMADLLTDRQFFAFCMTASLAMAGFFTYLAASSFVLTRVYGVSEERYTAIIAVNALASTATGVAFRLGVGRWRAESFLRVGLGTSLAGAATLALLGLVRAAPLAAAWGSTFLLMAGLGMALPALITLGQQAGAAFPGSASALQGSLQMGVGAALTPLTGLLGQGSVIPMAGMIALFLVLALGVEQWRRRVLPPPSGGVPVPVCAQTTGAFTAVAGVGTEPAGTGSIHRSRGSRYGRGMPGVDRRHCRPW
jgi:DHA1 family bicyclomycin/chloramphenicol resistance-like MFS transporter